MVLGGGRVANCSERRGNEIASAWQKGAKLSRSFSPFPLPEVGLTRSTGDKAMILQTSLGVL
jgi:hypothetical protein